MLRGPPSRFKGVTDDGSIRVHADALRTIQASSPSSLQSGIAQAHRVGGSAQRAVLYFGILGAALALEQDDSLMDAEKAWDLYSAHVATLAQCTYDEFVRLTQSK